MRPGLVERVFGPEVRWANFAWLSLLSALVLSLLGIYVIDVATAPGSRLTGPAGATLSATRLDGAGTPGGASGGGGDAVLHLSRQATQQVVYLCVGLLAAGVAVLPRPHMLRMLTWPILAVVIGLLVFLLLPFVPASIVRPRNGCRGWIDLGPADMQPAELAKIAYILAASEYLRFRSDHRTWAGLVPPALITMVPVALITLQPDFGTALLFIPTAFAILLAAGAKLKHLSVVVLAGALAAPAMYPFLKPHQKARIVGLVKQISGDRSTAHDSDIFQATTAAELVGAGGLWGYGDTKARAVVHFSRLPERHNDMVFAVVGARFGLAGAVCVFGLLGAWAGGALLTAASSADPAGRLICVGCAAITITQAMTNIGMNVGVMPIVGVPLPFVSHGGSSLVSVWIMTGLIVSVGLRPTPRMARPTFEFGRPGPRGGA